MSLEKKDSRTLEDISKSLYHLNRNLEKVNKALIDQNQIIFDSLAKLNASDSDISKEENKEKN